MTLNKARQVNCTLKNGCVEKFVMTDLSPAILNTPENQDFHYGFHETPYGECMALTNPLGLCALAFVRDGNRDDALRARTTCYKYGRWHEDAEKTLPYVNAIFNSSNLTNITLFLRGSEFQLNVWEGLMQIPRGHVCAYGEVARLAQAPRAIQAAGQAISRNPIALIIPCHRVVKKGGDLGGYRWGSACKQAILRDEGIDLDNLPSYIREVQPI